MQDIRQEVRDRYGSIAAASNTANGCGVSSCCSGDSVPGSTTCSTANELGYSTDELHGLPEGADLGLGCGNPQALAALQTGETVLDLGSGAGIDCFLAARKVGDTGRVIGVDMTPEMLQRARDNARQAETLNVEFRLGEIEHLPVADSSVDVIISNCVINLSPDKPAVFREALRVLKRGGRLTVADIVASAPLPDAVRADVALHVGCIAGAATIDETKSMLVEAGFEGVSIDVNEASRQVIGNWLPDAGLENYVVSAMITAFRP